MTLAQFQDALPLAILALVIGIFLGCVLSHIEQRGLDDKRSTRRGDLPGAEHDRAAREEAARMCGCAEES